MKIFIFDYVEQCSSNYHSGGGVVVIAKDVEHAIELLSKDDNIEITDKEWSKVESFDLKEEQEPKIWVMPDAGCC